MTTPFDRPRYGFRFEEIRRGDSLQLIAARTLGDAARWSELIAFNDLVPPYVTDDPTQVRPGVLLSGEFLLVPAPTPTVTTASDPDEVFLRDIQITDGNLVADGGDLAVVRGRDNFKQAITHRVETERGELIYHMQYGNRVRQLIGAVNGPTAALLAAQYTKAAVQADPRVAAVSSATATVTGDAVSVVVTAEAVNGKSVQVEANP